MAFLISPSDQARSAQGHAQSRVRTRPVGTQSRRDPSRSSHDRVSYQRVLNSLQAGYVRRPVWENTSFVSPGQRVFAGAQVVQQFFRVLIENLRSLGEAEKHLIETLWNVGKKLLEIGDPVAGI